MTSPDQSFPALLSWWAEQNPKGRILCPGLDSTQGQRPVAVPGAAGQPQEIVNQIRLTRSQRGASGHIHWNMKSLMRNPAFDEALEREFYQQPALMPPSPWLGHAQPAKPKLAAAKGKSGSELQLTWSEGGPGQAWLWLLETRSGGKWTQEVLPAARTVRVWNSAPPEVVALRAVGRNGELSARVGLEARGSAQ